MGAMRWIKGMLRTSALAAAGLLSDAVAVDAVDARLESENRLRDVEPRATYIGSVRSLPRLSDAPALNAARLAVLVDEWGELEPALAGMLVGTALCTAPPLARTQLVCEWATSPSVVHRRAVARALAHPFMCAGVPTAIETLAADSDAHVRTAAMQAALLRFGHDPRRYGAVLDRGDSRRA